MRAVVFDLNLAKYAVARAVGRLVPAAFYGPGSCVALRDVPTPSLRGPEWARIKVELAGVCGSDLAAITFHMSPALSPFGSFPVVLGHEVYGRVAEAGAASGVKEGDRVVIEPALGCMVRGFDPPCTACANGDTGLCARVTDGELGPGKLTGFCAALPGGWSEMLVAHRWQIFKVPDRVSDEAAVLAEPLAVGLHAVLRRTPRSGERSLVIGGGPIAYAVLSGLRQVGCTAELALLALHRYQAELGLKLGVHHAITADDGPPEDAVERLTGARRHKPIIGPPVLVGGFDVVFDCVGTGESLAQALRFVRPRGSVVMVGCASHVSLDLSMLWAHEVDLLGVYTYGVERATRRRTFDMVMEWLASSPLPLAELVTHRFPLEGYRQAIKTNLERAQHRAVKAAFDNRGAARA